MLTDRNFLNNLLSARLRVRQGPARSRGGRREGGDLVTVTVWARALRREGQSRGTKARLFLFSLFLTLRSASRVARVGCNYGLELRGLPG